MGLLSDACNLLKYVAAAAVGAGSMKLGEFYMEECKKIRPAPRMALDVYIHQVKEGEGSARSPAEIYKAVVVGDPGML